MKFIFYGTYILVYVYSMKGQLVLYNYFVYNKDIICIYLYLSH